VWCAAKDVGVEMTFSTDLFGSRETQAEQPLEFTARAKYFTPYEILIQATKSGADAVAMTGKLNPYSEGPLGVIQQGAYADLLIVGGNPLEDITLLADPGKNLTLIMKDGKIYKNTLK